MTLAVLVPLILAACAAAEPPCPTTQVKHWGLVDLENGCELPAYWPQDLGCGEPLNTWETWDDCSRSASFFCANGFLVTARYSGDGAEILISISISSEERGCETSYTLVPKGSR